MALTDEQIKKQRLDKMILSQAPAINNLATNSVASKSVIPTAGEAAATQAGQLASNNMNGPKPAPTITLNPLGTPNNYVDPRKAVLEAYRNPKLDAFGDVIKPAIPETPSVDTGSGAKLPLVDIASKDSFLMNRKLLAAGVAPIPAATPPADKPAVAEELVPSQLKALNNPLSQFADEDAAYGRAMYDMSKVDPLKAAYLRKLSTDRAVAGETPFKNVAEMEKYVTDNKLMGEGFTNFKTGLAARLAPPKPAFTGLSAAVQASQPASQKDYLSGFSSKLAQVQNANTQDISQADEGRAKILADLDKYTNQEQTARLLMAEAIKEGKLGTAIALSKTFRSAEKARNELLGQRGTLTAQDIRLAQDQKAKLTDQDLSSQYGLAMRELDKDNTAERDEVKNKMDNERDERTRRFQLDLQAMKDAQTANDPNTLINQIKLQEAQKLMEKQQNMESLYILSQSKDPKIAAQAVIDMEFERRKAEKLNGKQEKPNVEVKYDEDSGKFLSFNKDNNTVSEVKTSKALTSEYEVLKSQIDKGEDAQGNDLTPDSLKRAKQKLAALAAQIQ